MSKYNIDQELTKIAKIKMPDNPALLPLMNRIIGFSKCQSDDLVVVTRHKTPGYGGAILDTLVIEPVHHKGELPCMVLYHGGGFVLKASFAHHSMAKLYASRLPCKVIYTDYRLAPEYPFPVPAEDCCCTYKWALEHTGSAPVIIAGDSAGGGKTTCVMTIDLMGTWLFGIPLGLVTAFVFHWPVPMVYLALSVDECIRFAVSLVVFRHFSFGSSGSQRF